MTGLKKFFKNSVAVYGKNGFQAVVGLLTVAIIARYLTLPNFGRYSFIVAFVAIFRILSTMGLNTILVREVAKNKEAATEFYASALVLQWFLSVATFLIIMIGIKFADPSPETFTATGICAAAVILEFIGKTFSAVFQAYEKMEFDTYKTFFSQGMYLAATFCATKLDLGLSGIFYAMLLSGVVDVLYGFCVVEIRFIPFRMKGHLTKTRYLIKEAIPLGLKRLIRRIGFRVDTLILAAIRTKAEVGLFHGVYKILQSTQFVAEGSLQALFPIFSRYHGTSQDSFNRAYEKSFKLLAVIGIPMSLFLCFFAREIILLILGDKFVGAEMALQIMSGVLGLTFLSNLTENILTAAGRQSLCTWATAAALAVNVGLDYLLIPSWGYIGAAFATFLAEFMLTGLSFYYISKLTGNNRIFKEAFKPFLCGAATLIVLYFLKNTNMFFAASVGAVFYVILLIITKTFTQEEKMIFLGIFKKA